MKLKEKFNGSNGRRGGVFIIIDCRHIILSSAHETSEMTRVGSIPLQ